MAKAVDRGVAFVPGSTTMIDDKAVCSSFRMNYSTASKEQIESGIKTLGDLLKEEEENFKRYTAIRRIDTGKLCGSAQKLGESVKNR